MNSKREWVMSTSKPRDTRGNGLHYKNCHHFGYPARKATPEEMNLPPCGSCGPDDAPSELTCPIHYIVMSKSGVCSSCEEEA